MSLGSITNMLCDMPRPTDLGAGHILLQSRGPGELFFGALRKNGLISPYVLHAHSLLCICRAPAGDVGPVCAAHRAITCAAAV